MKKPINFLQHFIFVFSLFTFFVACQNGSMKEEQKAVSNSVRKDSITAPQIHPDDFHVFEVHPMENGDDYHIFISLSDIYSDSISVPPEIIKNQKNLSFAELKRFELPATYREKLLKGTQLQENDTLYIYNYQSNNLEKFPINSLKAVANLNVYTSEGEEILDYDYMIGFELPKTESDEKAMERANFNFAYFGKENPFTGKPLKSISWKKVAANQFPLKKQHPNLKPGDVYYFKDKEMQYFIQDLMGENEVSERKLAVLKNGKLIFDKTYTRGEGAEFIPLNGIVETDYPRFQWTGNLFKGKPAVIFGFVSESFGCSEITFLDQKYSEIYTNCDNRH